MNRYLQLFLILCLWSFVQSEEEAVRIDRCIQLRSYNLKIPKNNLVEGLQRASDASWYTHVNWTDNPAGKLTMSYRREYEWLDGWRHEVTSRADADLTPEGKDWKELGLRLLGLNQHSVTIPGRLRTPHRVFDEGRPCTMFHFESPFWSGRHRVFLHFEDDDGTKLLTGQVLLSPAPTIDE